MKAQRHHTGAARVKVYHGRYHTKKQHSQSKQSIKFKKAKKKQKKIAKEKQSKIIYTHYQLFEKPNQPKVSCQPKMSAKPYSFILNQGSRPTAKTAPLFSGAGFKACSFTGGHRA